MINIAFNIDSYQIKFVNSIFGREKILVDGIEKSNKHSICGTDHNFKIKEDNFSLVSSYKQFTTEEMKFKIYKNGDLVESKILELNSKEKIPWMVISVILGIGLYQLLNFLVGKLLEN